MTFRLHTPEALARWRASGVGRIALVPTMGSLHEGHLQLVDCAREHGAERVITSIFVNPTQFGPNEDFDRYPRSLEADIALLQARGCDAVYAPDVDTMYPEGQAAGMEIRFPGLDDILCGASRPGHFNGVARVVSKLFHHVQPDCAVFGRKDYQQLMIIQRMVRVLSFPVQIIAAPIVREQDGLAMSSRNRYLTERERAKAPLLSQALQDLGEVYRQQGDAAVAEIQQVLIQQGFDVDYLQLRDAEGLAPASAESRHLVALVAAWLGSTRLLDNTVFAAHDN
jgi:pantoate--beta-alanine ligase